MNQEIPGPQIPTIDSLAAKLKTKVPEHHLELAKTNMQSAVVQEISSKLALIVGYLDMGMMTVTSAQWAQFEGEMDNWLAAVGIDKSRTASDGIHISQENIDFIKSRLT